MPRVHLHPLVLLALVTLACAGGDADVQAPTTGPDPVLARLGAATFATHCASCHGADGRGHGPAAAALRTPPADLTRIAARRNGPFPTAEIATYIDGRFELAAHGSREMPVWGERLGARVSPDVHPDEVVRGRIVTLLEHLESIQRPD